MKGRAECTRLCLFIAGKEFEDERIDFAELMKRKETGAVKFG